MDLQFGASFAAGQDPPYETTPATNVPPSVAVERPTRTGDPEGSAQDVHRFSMRQDASSKNPGYASDGWFELDLSVFFGDFLCAKESYPRDSAEALLLTADRYSHAQPISLTLSAANLRPSLMKQPDLQVTHYGH